jgi:hypothetical protein
MLGQQGREPPDAHDFRDLGEPSYGDLLRE